MVQSHIIQGSTMMVFTSWKWQRISISGFLNVKIKLHINDTITENVFLSRIANGTFIQGALSASPFSAEQCMISNPCRAEEISSGKR